MGTQSEKRKMQNHSLKFKTFLIFSYGFTLLALNFSFALAQTSPDLGPVGPKTGTPQEDTDQPPVKPAVDLPYKPTPTKPPPDLNDDSMGEEGDAGDPVYYAPPVEIVIPFIPSKFPDPIGAPDPEF